MGKVMRYLLVLLPGVVEVLVRLWRGRVGDRGCRDFVVLLYGILASDFSDFRLPLCVIAHAALESDWGRGIGGSYNLFSIKGGMGLERYGSYRACIAHYRQIVQAYYPRVWNALSSGEYFWGLQHGLVGSNGKERRWCISETDEEYIRKLGNCYLVVLDLYNSVCRG